MQTQLVTFDELLHVHRNHATRSSPKHTVFSFMSNFEYFPYVTVPGFPRLEAGMRVAVLLREQDNWKTLIGWRDLDTGDLVAQDPGWHLSRLVFGLAWLAFALYLLRKFELGSLNIQLLLFLLFFGAGASLTIVEFRAWRKAQADLVKLKLLPHNEA